MKKGHALAKVSMMREAEECYAMAISCDPFNWEYYRHRAHRFLSCWRFEDAAADFVIASRLNPNDWNVFYHLGLSYFLLRDYAKAAKAYARCYELTDADPELIAVTDWYYMTLKRLGNDEEAAKILARITDGARGEGGRRKRLLLRFRLPRLQGRFGTQGVRGGEPKGLRPLDPTRGSASGLRKGE